MNNLKNEKSPYLLQHSGNPVNWYAWCDEAFDKAKKENKPIFLSIGYSTCHWCHVMAHETFEDNETAGILNKYFISIKVDREERPDIDNIYMTACQAYTGAGGWPLTIFIDHDKRPFYAGTYFENGVFKNILHRIKNLWETDNERLVSQAKRLVDYIKNEKKHIEYLPIDNSAGAAVKLLKENFDPFYGGFSRAPKFPTAHNLLFLLEHYSLSGDKESLAMCEKTLGSIKDGGIYDHVGSGFSRYSTDKFWLVPHFEKMLYDNAMLILAYCRCYEITKNNFYADTVKDVIAYLTRDMSNSNGAFYTAEDADSEGREGLFYTFTFEEINSLLKDDAAEFCGYYNISKEGNFKGRNILNTINKKIPQDRKEFTDICLKRIFNYRNKRIRPHRDEKILLSHNGLAVAALSAAGKALRQKDYINTAEKIIEFIDKNMTDSKGKLLSFYMDGPGRHVGFADDYAFLIWGLLELNCATSNNEYLKKAIKLHDKFTEIFFDSDGGFYLSDINAEQVIMRTKDLYDGAMPSSNSVSLNNLLQLYNLTGNVNYLQQLALCLKYFSADIEKFPIGHIYSVNAILKLQNQLPNIKICYNSVCHPAPKTLREFIDIFK